MLIRWGIGLSLGGWVGYRLKNPIRSFVVSLLPVATRISPKSYLIQTRASAVVVFVLIVGIATLVNLGMIRAAQATGIQTTTTFFPARSNAKKAKKKPTALVRSLPEPAADPAPSFYDNPFQKQNEKASVRRKEKPILRNDTPVDRPAKPRRQRPLPPPAVPHYAQVCALDQLERAKAQQTSCQNNCRQNVVIGFADRAPLPYKVLIGPFESRRAANKFLKRKGWKGYPRTGEGLMIFE